MTELEQFRNAWGELSCDEKISIYRDYQREIGDEEEWYDFDEEFFEIFFESKPLEAIRAWHFGGDNSWNDEYIHFNAYGNLETACEYQVAEESERMVNEIFEHPEVWQDYITLDDADDDDA